MTHNLFFTIARNLGHLEPAHISGNLTEKMAAVGSKRKRSIVNCKDLNAISCVVLYDTARKSKGNFLKWMGSLRRGKLAMWVQHVRMKCFLNLFDFVIFWDDPKTCLFFHCQSKEYLVKLKGWPLQACSWESEDYLIPALLWWMFALYNWSSSSMYLFSVISFPFFTECAVYNC